MSDALCLACGALKSGALQPCGRCQASPTHEPALDERFSHPRLSHESLRALGGIIERIRPAFADPALRFWIFMRYVSERVPGILVADPPDGLKAQVQEALARLDLPAVQVSRAMAPTAPSTGEGLGWMGWTVRICALVLFGVWVAVTWFID